MAPGGDRDPKPEDLDPGIRRAVALLRLRGFDTTDSGDGVSKAEAIAEGDALDFPHIFMVSTPETLLQDARRLYDFLTARVGTSMDAVQIEATYDPANGSATILLSGLDDARLPL